MHTCSWVPVCTLILWKDSLMQEWKKIFTFPSLYPFFLSQVPLVAVDSYFYGKTVIAPLNILLYNVFTPHGPDLYGNIWECKSFCIMLAEAQSELILLWTIRSCFFHEILFIILLFFNIKLFFWFEEVFLTSFKPLFRIFGAFTEVIEPMDLNENI